MVVGCNLLGIPSLELVFRFGGHSVGIVVESIGQGSLVLLILQSVEFVREESLAQFVDPERDRKVGEWKW